MAFDSRMKRWDATVVHCAKTDLVLVAMFDVFASDLCDKDRATVVYSGLVSMDTLIAGKYIKDVHQFAPTSPQHIAIINKGMNVSSFMVFPREMAAAILASEKTEAKATISVKGVKGFGKIMINVVSAPGVACKKR
jgi:hypothetical protein